MMSYKCLHAHHTLLVKAGYRVSWKEGVKTLYSMGFPDDRKVLIPRSISLLPSLKGLVFYFVVIESMHGCLLSCFPYWWFTFLIHI